MFVDVTVMRVWHPPSDHPNCTFPRHNLFLSVYDVCSDSFLLWFYPPAVEKMTRCSCLCWLFDRARVILSSPLVEVIDIAALVELLDEA